MIHFFFVFQVPTDFGIIDVFDMYFKVYTLFNSNFHPNVCAMMTFVQHYIFKMNHDHIRLTPRVRELALQFEYLFIAVDENANRPTLNDLNG